MPEVIAPNLKRRLSGVTATVVRLVPVQAAHIDIATFGPGLPPDLPRIGLRDLLTLPRSRPAIWHARRNTEMLVGLVLRHLFRRNLKLLFTSAAQRRHSGYTRRLIARMDALVATSPAAASYLEHPAEVVLHGVDTETFRPAEDRAALKAALGLEPGTWIGTFGRVRAQKGIDVLAEALLRLMPGRPDLRALIVGRPDDAAFIARIQARLAVAGLEGRVRWIPHLSWEALARHYAALDLYVAPPRWEGFGLTPLEAMASGVPVVATTVGAFPALIPSTGRLVPPGDADALTDAMAEMLAADLPALGAAARAHVLAHHRIEAEAAALVAIYRRLLAV